jgi:cation diffusion facilitator family transporter
LGINLVLGLVKLMGGIVGDCFALIADAVNSLGDVVTNVVLLVALRLAQQPPDAEHPYGHSRAEGIAASNIAVVVVVSACFVGWEAIQRLYLKHELPATWTLWIAGINVIIKEGLYHYKIRVGKRTGSLAIIANAWDHRSDALCALAVLVGLSVVLFGGSNYLWADEVASLIVVCIILWSGFKLIRCSTSELMDVQANPEFVEGIRDEATAVDAVKAIETLWVRKSGLEYFADIHIQVDPDISVAEGHRIGHKVKDRLLAKFNNLRDVLVHLEPYQTDNQRS